VYDWLRKREISGASMGCPKTGAINGVPRQLSRPV
jgi:hypothetical protein